MSKTSTHETSDWPYSVPLPERLSTSYDRYRKRGGLLDVKEDADAYAIQGKLPDPQRFVFLSLAFDQIHKEGLAGDIAELGVYKGQTAIIMARNARRLGRTAWLLDTFTGFASQDFAGIDAGINTGQGPSFADTSLEIVRAKVGIQNTRYIQGFFPESATQLPSDGHYCLVHIDCDLYAPIMSALEYFYPRMVQGGYIVVHDYGSLSWDGAEKAVDIFFANKPECVVQIPDSAGSVVMRKQRDTQGITWLQAKQLVKVGSWLPAANNQLASLLDNGWSQSEPWGVWGVGASHVISLALSEPNLTQFSIELEVHAVVMSARPTFDVDVLVNGSFAEVWRFTESHNRSIRTVTVHQPSNMLVSIELRPHSVQSPHNIDRLQGETRPLGVFLHKLRVSLT